MRPAPCPLRALRVESDVILYVHVSRVWVWLIPTDYEPYKTRIEDSEMALLLTLIVWLTCSKSQ